MKKRVLSLLIVACMLLSLVPVTAFAAAQSYGIYVGGTEVTTANYTKITGKGISGIVRFDPSTDTLTLINATITGYYDVDPSVGDLYGILSLRENLSICIMSGGCSIRTDASGTNASACTAIGAAGDLEIKLLSDTLNIEASNAAANIGILCNQDLTVGYGTLNITAGDGAFSCGIYTDGNSKIESGGKITSGTSSEYDSVAIYCGGDLNLGKKYNIDVTAGTSLKGSSFGVLSNGYVITSNVTLRSGCAPNGSSIGIYGTNVNILQATVCSGTGLESIGAYATNHFSAASNVVKIIAGTSTQNASVGVYSEGSVGFGDTVLTISGDNVGVYADDTLVVNKSIFLKVTITGGNYAINTAPTYTGTGVDSYYWTGNPESTEPVRNFSHEDVLMTDPEQYKYIYIISEDYALPTPFDDVPKDAYYIDPVLWAVENEITKGTGAITFSPEDTCTRAQTVTFLWRAAGCPEPESTAMPFTDVKADDYFYDAVLWAVENEITVGTSDTTFSPKDTVTRAQVVTFLWRAEHTPEPVSTKHSFTDVPADEYYAGAVLWAVENGITIGTSDTTFSPKAGCTRAQIVTFLHRYRLVPSQPLSADYADEEVLSSGDYSQFILDTSEYAVDIAFRANDVLKNVTFSSMVFTDEGMQIDKALYTQKELSPDLPLVVRVSFPGDMTTYCISFTDPFGNTRCYTVSTSGKDGSLLLQEYNVT